MQIGKNVNNDVAEITLYNSVPVYVPVYAQATQAQCVIVVAKYSANFFYLLYRICMGN